MSSDTEEAAPSPLAATLLLFAALCFAAYRSPHHWSAAGLACMTASALVAAPELIERLLIATNRPRARIVAYALFKVAWITSRAVYLALAFLSLLLLGLAAATRSELGSALAAIALVAGVGGAVELTLRQLRSLANDIATGGAVDQRVEARFGAGIRWCVAGSLFLLGTVLQLVGTFVE